MLAASKRRESSSSGSEHTHGQLNAKFIEKDDEIEKPYDEITVQIRQGERGGQANDGKNQHHGEACFWSDPRL